MLLRGGIDLRGVRSHWDEIDALRQMARDTMTLASDLARIRIGPDEVKIQRECTAELRQAAEGGSLVVVGDPGSGKSGVLYDFVEGLIAEGRDVVYLTADRTADLGTEIAATLCNWPGTQPGFLVIDALDAVRSEQATRNLRDMLFLVLQRASRW